MTSDSKVVRDMFYTGNAKQERCSVVLRVAPTFIRFGSFEIFKPTDSTTGTQVFHHHSRAWHHHLTQHSGSGSHYTKIQHACCLAAGQSIAC